MEGEVGEGPEVVERWGWRVFGAGVEVEHVDEVLLMSIRARYTAKSEAGCDRLGV